MNIDRKETLWTKELVVYGANSHRELDSEECFREMAEHVRKAIAALLEEQGTPITFPVSERGSSGRSAGVVSNRFGNLTYSIKKKESISYGGDPHVRIDAQLVWWPTPEVGPKFARSMLALAPRMPMKAPFRGLTTEAEALERLIPALSFTLMNSMSEGARLWDRRIKAEQDRKHRKELDERRELTSRFQRVAEEAIRSRAYHRIAEAWENLAPYSKVQRSSEMGHRWHTDLRIAEGLVILTDTRFVLGTRYIRNLYLIPIRDIVSTEIVWRWTEVGPTGDKSDYPHLQIRLAKPITVLGFQAPFAKHPLEAVPERDTDAPYVLSHSDSVYGLQAIVERLAWYKGEIGPMDEGLIEVEERRFINQSRDLRV